MLGKILKFRLNRCLSFLSIHIFKLEISGCDKSTPLKRNLVLEIRKDKERFRERYGRIDVRTMLTENIPITVVAFMWFNLPRVEHCCPLELCGVWFPFLIC
jgi:hypothetical protein